MSKWNADSGILRKKQPKEKHEDLLVFGYACKLFRDDEKALLIDQGKYLIPWMGDETLKIDRYDGRGALSELASFEASREGYDAMRWLGLSDSDRRIEQLCDDERYYSLRNNDEEEALYKEEELKRLQQKSNKFQYSYDVPADNSQEINNVQTQEEAEPFTPPTELDVPIDIPIPKTCKENFRIEKTADFISRQGPQMEILIKAKQGGNPQFSFMNQDDQLYKYYRHVLSAIKDGRYKVKKNETEQKQDNNEQETTEDHYLHPSLLTTTNQLAPLSATTTLPTVPYKPSADCAYSQLVNRIQGNTTNAQDNKIQMSHMTYEQQQYYQYYYASQYYQYYKQMSQYQNQNEDGQNTNSGYHYTQQSASNNNPYAQIVSNLNKEIVKKNDITKGPVLYSQNQQVTEKQMPAAENVIIKKPLLSLAQYGSDSEDEDESGETIDEPPSEVKIIIDKMAAYVAKNGADFEAVVRSKDDPRFNFLDVSHEHHRYYKTKIDEHKQLTVIGETNSTDNGKEQNNTATKVKEKKPLVPVSFSIKKPKEDGPKEIKSALPVEESDEDGCNTPEIPTEKIEINKRNPSPTTETTITTTKEIFDMDDPILEMIDLTDESEDKRDAKRAEDRIKDKLAAAAREKLASVARDRALQLERRKKAAAFLKMKSNVAPPTEQQTTIEETSKPEVVLKDSVEVVDDTDSEIEHNKKSSKRKKSHKRKHSKSKHESRSHRKSKKKRKKSNSYSSEGSHHEK